MQRIEIINNWNLSRVFSELEQGNMRIPRFQRSYVWERSKIVKLLNSIYNEYPIGSFFLWETDGEMESFCRDITEFGFPNKPAAGKFTFILDGQQRITSLYVALKGKKLGGVNYGDICFNLDKRVFKIPTLKSEENNIPVWQIYDMNEYSELLIKFASTGNHELAKTLQGIKAKFDNYPVSIIKSMDMGLDEVVTIFERINQGGKRLSLFDLVHASVWSQEFDLREEISAFNKEKAIAVWGKVQQEVFTQALALNITGDCVKAHQLKLKNEDCVAIWDRTLECLRLSIDYIKKNFGVQSSDIIPYQNILPLLQYYFFVSNSKGILPEHKQMLSDWFWTVTFSNRYSSTTLTKMTEDAKWINQIVQGSTMPRIYTVKLGIEDLKKIRMNTASVIKNGVLCLMAMNSPCDFDNGDSVTLDNTNASRANSKENHHFFPFSLHDSFGLSQNDINSLLNFAFISKRLNLSISNKKPSVYLSEYEAINPDLVEHVYTHFINKDALNAAKENDFKVFIEKRGEAILAVINKLCRVNDNVTTVSANILDSAKLLFEEDELAEDEYEDDNEVQRPMITWLVPSNQKFFDLKGCIDKYGFVFWHRYYNFLEGDIVYIYSTKPEGRIRYKLVVEEGIVDSSEDTSIGEEFRSDKYAPEYWKESIQFSKFKLLEETNGEQLTLEALMGVGLSCAPRGAMCLSEEMVQFINSNWK